MRRFGWVTAIALLVLASAPAAHADGGDSGRYDKPRDGFAPPGTVLSDGEPADVGLAAEPIDEALAAVHAGTEAAGDDHPVYAGAVTTYGHDGTVVTKDVTGHALRYADGDGTELPDDEQIPMRSDTIFDMASVSKLFTSIVVMQQVETGTVELDAPVADYVPEFAEGGKDEVTVEQLLTHTSGLQPTLPLWEDYPDPESRINAALTAEPETEPGSTYEYSDLNLIALGVLAERVSGESLDDLVASGITAPLRMVDTGYNPEAELSRIAATEYQEDPPRGMVHGEVHDENAWSLEGVAGHAGIFSTADDMAVLAQALLNGGTYDGERILDSDTVADMITNYTPEFPGDEHGLGFELDQRWYMSGLSGPRTAGHTGYTGTSLVIDFSSRSFAILLTNRVHPSRDWSDVNGTRQVVGQGLAEALAVRPQRGPDAWFARTEPDDNATLDATVTVPQRGGRLSFDTFVDTDQHDALHLETSADGGQTWEPVPFNVHDGSGVTPTKGEYSDSGDRRWKQGRANLEPGEQVLRWRYATDDEESGRGVHVDGVRAVGGGVLLDGEREPERFTADDWEATDR